MSKFELLLPKMGESVEEATIINWLKNIGDKITVDDLVVEIATDKVDSEVPSEVSGILIEKLCKVNDVVKVGQPLAIIETEYVKSNKINLDPVKETKNLISKAKEVATPPKEFIRKKIYSPLVRNISKKEGVTESELENIKGTGKEGRVTKNDLLSFLNKRNGDLLTSQDKQGYDLSQKDKEGIYEMTRIEKLISDHMIKSQNESAHVQAFIEADISNIWEWREKNKKIFYDREGEK